MARKKNTQDNVSKWKRKYWVKVQAPPMLGGKEVGETITSDEKLVLGREIKMNLMVLTKDIKKQNTNIILKVVDVKGTSAKTEIKGYEMIPSILKRLIRKNKRKIDDSFIATTNDGTLVKVKPMILTNYIVPKDVRRSIRLLTRYYILDLVAKGNYDDFINAILSTDIQRALKAKLDKVSPISVVLVRAFNKIYKPRTKDLRVAKSYAEFLESEKEFYDKALSDTSVKQRKEKKPKILSESEKPKDYDEELVSVNIE